MEKKADSARVVRLVTAMMPASVFSAGMTAFAMLMVMMVIIFMAMFMRVRMGVCMAILMTVLMGMFSAVRNNVSILIFQKMHVDYLLLYR